MPTKKQRTEPKTERKPDALKKSAPATSTSEDTEMSTDLKQYVNTKDAATLLGVDVSQVSRLAKSGRIKGMKFGHDWLIFRPSILTYFQSKAASGKPSSRPPLLTAE